MRLCLDFDGVIAKYPSGEVVPGAIEFIRKALKECSELSVFSTRSGNGQIPQMQLFLIQNGLTSEEALSIKWYTYKPPAMVFIDDRAWRFEGTWPDLEELKKFKTWEES